MACGMAGVHSMLPTAASLPPACRLLSQDSPSGQHRAVLSRCLRQGHELLEVTRAVPATAALGLSGLVGQLAWSGGHRGHGVLVLTPSLQVWGSSGRSHSVDLTVLGKHGEVYTEGRAPVLCPLPCAHCPQQKQWPQCLPGAWLCLCQPRLWHLFPCQGPLPAWPGPIQRHGCSTWLRRAGPNHGPPAPGTCQEQPGWRKRTRTRRWVPCAL